MRDIQEKNYWRALKGCSDFEYSKSVVNRIVKDSVQEKEKIREFLGDDLLVMDKKINDTCLLTDFPWIKSFVDEQSIYSFSFENNMITERVTGKCRPLNKWLKEQENISKTLHEYIGYTKQLFISCNPWFLLGGSVGKDGKQLDTSCHYPGSSHKEYRSGPISYALDKHTILFGEWDNGIKGRQLVYLDLENEGFVTGRLYGSLKESDSSALRKVLYQKFSKTNAKKTKDFIVSKYNRFRGYLDESYFQGYRFGDKQIYIALEEPVCISCGEDHIHENIICSVCDESKSDYYCDNCGEGLNEDDIHYDDNSRCYCDVCFYERYFYCFNCGEIEDVRDACKIGGDSWCSSCAEKKGYAQCSDCDAWIDDYLYDPDGNIYCESCLPSDVRRCEKCGEICWEQDMTHTIEDEYYCSSCEDKHLNVCEKCESFSSSSLTETMEGVRWSQWLSVIGQQWERD